MKTVTDKNGILFDTVMISYANQLNLELHESSFANFECHTRNSYPFNRLFAVSFSNGEPSVVSNYETGEQFEMKPGHLYFFSYGFPSPSISEREPDFLRFISICATAHTRMSFSPNGS